MTSTYDPVVLISPALTMQRISLAVSRENGKHTHYVRGVIAANKALAFAAKMEARWELSLSHDQRTRRTAAKRATFTLFFQPCPDSQSLEWVLFRRPGHHPLLETESWQAVVDKPRLVFRGYELVQMSYTKADLAQFAARIEKRGASPPTKSWTWRMTDDTFESFKKRIRSSLSTLKRTSGKNDRPFLAVIDSMWGVPGFRTTRDQVMQLRQYIDEQLFRLKLPAYVFEMRPRYLSFRRCTSYPLSTLVYRALNGADTWFPAPPRGKPSGIQTKLHKEQHQHADQEAPDHEVQDEHRAADERR